MAGPFDLTGQNIENTYQRVLQTPDGVNIYDGTGSAFTVTAVATAGGLNQSIQFNSSSVLSGSNNLKFDYTTNNIILTGSLLVTQSHISTIDYIDFTIAANPVHNEGRIHWTDDTKTLQVDTDVNNFMIEVGHQNVVRVYNPNNFTLQTGTVVYISGSQGTRPSVVTASYQSDQLSAATLGFVAQPIVHTGGTKTGYVVTNGILRGVNTNAYPVGTQLYLSSSGTFSNQIPDAPLHEVRLGKVIVSGPDGVIYVDVMNGYELTELHDVKTTTYTNGDLLIQSGNLWINSKQLTGSYGLTGSLTATSFTGSLLGTATTASYYQETDPIFTAKSASLATTGSNTFNGNQNITGDVNITGSLIVNDGTYDIVDTRQRFLNDDSGVTTVDWQNKTLKQAGNRDTVDWNQAYLNDYTNGALSINWENRKTFDSFSTESIDWQNRILYAADGTTPSLNWSSSLITTSPTFFTYTISTGSQEEFSSNSNYAGTVIEGVIEGGVQVYDLVCLRGGQWEINSQSGVDRVKLKLGIYLGNNLVLTEGHIMIDNLAGNRGPSVQAADFLNPVFVREDVGTSMSCNPPTAGYVKILGHIYYQNQNNNDYYIMRFNPSNDYYLLG